MNDPLLTFEKAKQLKQQLTEFMMMYKFALDEMETRISILQEEFELMHDYSPIEHVKTRLKSPESIFEKARRKNIPFHLHVLKNSIQDIAGIRITCSFLSDIYRLEEMLRKQSDMHVVTVKDYIKKPKENGYRSLHMIVKVPVYTSARKEEVFVEIQIRTIAMDFWASLEHKIFYKYNQNVPKQLISELTEAAHSAAALDEKMEHIHHEMTAVKQKQAAQPGESEQLQLNSHTFAIPRKLLESLQKLPDDLSGV
ncbi:GTP pyrophosphokinase [Shouchella clausii]|uniref:GTP pyrophosphokinase n=1 Tax=Shouchella clausii TaxID=79880 RepID=UPI0021478D7C|nr:GTP pyrophosphokinase family protein [Shouchella clausii]MCR1287976.1 GTP pyrophosphokinase family protein [Shouchella clausii]